MLSYLTESNKSDSTGFQISVQPGASHFENKRQAAHRLWDMDMDMPYAKLCAGTVQPSEVCTQLSTGDAALLWYGEHTTYVMALYHDPRGAEN